MMVAVRITMKIGRFMRSGIFLDCFVFCFFLKTWFVLVKTPEAELHYSFLSFSLEKVKGDGGERGRGEDV